MYKLYIPVCINQLQKVCSFPYFHQEGLVQVLYHTFRLYVIGFSFFLSVVSVRDQSDQTVIFRINFK